MTPVFNFWRTKSNPQFLNATGQVPNHIAREDILKYFPCIISEREYHHYYHGMELLLVWFAWSTILRHHFDLCPVFFNCTLHNFSKWQNKCEKATINQFTPALAYKADRCQNRRAITVQVHLMRSIMRTKICLSVRVVKYGSTSTVILWEVGMEVCLHSKFCVTRKIV